MPSNVLIVEDSAEVRAGLQIALESQGYRVQSAADGREGIRVFREWRPDIALLDIRMPRMSGIDVCTLIRNESNVPVIMFSGVDEGDDVRLAIQRGADDYVLKDTGFRELLNRVGKHLRRRAADLLIGLPGASMGDSVGPLSGSGEPSTVGVGHKADLTGLNVQTVTVDGQAGAVGGSTGALEDLVIVAHSEPEALSQLSEIAARTSFEVEQAVTGRESIELLVARRPKLLIVGSVLTDMNCIEVVKAAANHPLGDLIGVVLALGKRSPELARRARYMGVQETVYQPWSDGRMDIAIRSALASTHTARSRLKAA